ncbi:MAG: hypothetical protein WAN23_10270 [Candidatus Acidiferrales bacterium]
MKCFVFVFSCPSPKLKTSVPPEIARSDKSSLHFYVPAVGEVTKQIATIDGVKILYSIGKEDVPAGASDSIRKRIALVLFVLLVFLTAICVITAKSIRKLNKGAI